MATMLKVIFTMGDDEEIMPVHEFREVLQDALYEKAGLPGNFLIVEESESDTEFWNAWTKKSKLVQGGS